MSSSGVRRIGIRSLCVDVNGEAAVFAMVTYHLINKSQCVLC